MTQIWKKLCSVFLTLCLVLTLMPVTAFAADANSLKSTIEKYTGGTGATVTVPLSAEVDGDTVTVEGYVYNATSTLDLSIDTGVTVIWKASITSAADLNEKLIYLTGGGTFEVADGGEVCATGEGDCAIKAYCDVAVSGGTVSSTTGFAINTYRNMTVSGGTVSTTSGYAIYADGKDTIVTVSGGRVLATEGDGKAIKARNVNVTDTGEVIAETTGFAISADGNVTVGGGTVSANSGKAIFTLGNATVSGGTVSSTSNNAIHADSKTSTVTISGGTVSNSATSLVNPVILMYEVENTSDNVTVSGDGKVLAEADGGYAIMTYGNVKVTENAQVSATTASAICATGAGSTVTVSGGTVSNSAASLKPVIDMKNESNTSENVTVSGDGKVLAQADGGSAIMTYGNVKVTENGQVSATRSSAIYATGAGSTVTVTDSAQVSATSGRAIYTHCAGSTVTVSGDGKVLAQADGGHAIMTNGTVTVTDSAQVSATTGRAIRAFGDSSTVTVSGGGVFAYGTAITGENQVIYLQNNESGFTEPTSDGVVIAWNKDANTKQYDSGSNIHLSVSPSGTAAWSKKDGQSGIFYNNNTNTGFFAVDGVTVIKSSSPVTLRQLSYIDPTTLNLTYDGSQQGIGSVTAAIGVNLGAISVYYTGTDGTSYAKSTTVPTNAGTYQVTADVAESPDYAATSGLVLGTYTIAKAAAPAITWPTAADIIYGDTLSDSTLSGGSTELGSFAWTDGTVIPNVTNSGFEVTFTPSASTLQNYETISNTTGTVSIKVAKIGVMCDNQTYQVVKGCNKDYSFDLTTLLPADVDASQVSAYTYVRHTNTNSIFSDTPSVSGTTLTLPVASVDTAGLKDTVTIGFTSDNYGISNATITVEIVDKIPVTITADMTGGVYNGQPYGYSNLSVTSNNDSSVITDSITLKISYEGINSTSYSQSANAPKDAGKYMLTLSVPDSDITYTGSKVCTFTIEKRPVTVKADNKSMTKSGTLPGFTYTLDGQLSGETALNGTPALACTADGSKVGSFNITVDMTEVTYTANYKAAEPAFVSGTLTVSNPSTGGHSSGGGPSTTTPAPTVSGSTAITKVSAKTGSDGKAAASVTQSQVRSAIEAAQEAAHSNGEDPRVEIQVDGLTDTSTVETTLPESAVQALVTSEMESLTISGPVATMTFDAQAIASIADAASGDVSFTASQVDTSALSDAARQVVGDRPVYNFSVTSGGKTITQFDGTVTVSIPYTPTADEDVNAIVAYYINTDGEPELMTNCYYDVEAGALVFTTTHFSQYAVGYNKVTFSDVADTAWYADAISYLAARGVTGGTTETTFSPDATLTRGQFITLLLRSYGMDPDDKSADNFSDAGNTYYTGYLAAAKRLGISDGVGDNNFAPEKSVTRQEMFTLLYNALKAIDQLPEGNSGNTLSDFSDSGSVSSYAQEAMSYLVKTGAVSGNNGLLLPTASTTRAQMAQVLYKLLLK